MLLTGTTLALVGAAIALGGAGIASALGIAMAGVSAAGAVAETNENFKNAMVLQAMPQTQTIYGFITALLIVMGTGLLSGTVGDLSQTEGIVMLAAGCIMGLTAMSAVFQGQISAAGIASCAKNPDAFASNIVFSGQAETPAIFGFVVALIILVVGLGVLG